MLHGMVLRAKPGPVGFNSAVQRLPSTLDITKAPLCPSATTWSPCFGMRFFRLAMPQFPRAQARLLPLWTSNFATSRILNGFDRVFSRESSHHQCPLTVGCHPYGHGQQPRTGGGKQHTLKDENWGQTLLPMPHVRKKERTNQRPARRLGAN